MAITNLRASLERTLQNWLGERITLTKDIDKIREAYATLTEKEARLSRVERLIECSEVILEEITPGWDASKVRPKTKNANTMPFPVGDVIRMAFEILRDARDPLRTREIAEMIIGAHDMDPDDDHLVSRLTASIDSSLRKKIGVHVEKIGKWPIRWRILEHPTKPPFGR